MKNLLTILYVVLLGATPSLAQDTVTASKAELSIPFGVATGHLVTLGDYLVFVNDEKPDSSFSLRKSNIADAVLGDGVVTVHTKEAVGELDRFIFRLQDPAKVGVLIAWAREAPVPTLTAAQEQEESAHSAKVIGEYQVRHNHRFRGDCTGKLVATEDRISFESVSEIGHSRQWDISDVKELKRGNPYKLEIQPFVGNEYDFDLIGEGMSSREYKALADKVASARVPR